LPVDLRDGAFLHLSCYNRERADGEGHEALYLNPTTSTRYSPFMPRLIEGCGLRLVGGKGGLDRASVEAMQRQGCVYLSFLGGGCTLLAQAIRGVVSVHWSDYISQFRLLTLDVSELGPATVAIDAHGNSVYEQLRTQAEQRLRARRAAA
jgi:fumarate hydratase subunit beta